MMKRVNFILIALTLIFPLLVRAEEIPLTLDEAVAIAARDNRDILLKAEDVQKAKFKIAQAQSSLFPSLSFTGGWTDTRGYYTKDIGQTTTQTTLKQTLYKGGEIINTIKYNEYGFDIAQAVLDKTKLEIVLNVNGAFYTLLLANEYANLNKGILENTKEHLQFLQARYANGQASDSDILRIKESLESVQQAYEASLNQIESSQTLLKNLLYLSEEVKIRPNAEFNYEPKELAYDQAFLKAMSTRPEIRQYEAQEKAAQKGIEIAKADGRPTIYASWDYYSRSHLAAGTSRNWNDYSVIGFTFSWPVFDGWATKAKVEQAIIDLKEAQLSKEKTIKDIAQELKNAYLDLKNAVAKMQAMQAQINLYKDTLRVAEEKYKTGIASSLDLSDVSLSYAISLFNQKEAIYDYIIAKAKFAKATGG
jgi:outer membrane protein TolC